MRVPDACLVSVVIDAPPPPPPLLIEGTRLLMHNQGQGSIEATMLVWKEVDGRSGWSMCRVVSQYWSPRQKDEGKYIQFLYGGLVWKLQSSLLLLLVLQRT